MGTLTCKQKTRKWTLVALTYVLDMSRVNSQAIYAMTSRDTRTKSFEFGWELIISLIKPHMTNQITTGGISNNLEEFIRIDPPPSNDGKVRVRRVCQNEKHGD